MDATLINIDNNDSDNESESKIQSGDANIQSGDGDNQNGDGDIQDGVANNQNADANIENEDFKCMMRTGRALVLYDDSLDQLTTNSQDDPLSQECAIPIDHEQCERNNYAAKKTVAQGMMDIALITANANQLRYVIEFNSKSVTFYFIVVLIGLSLFLQIAVGISLIFKGRKDFRGQSKSPEARRINNYVVVGVFMITIINVFIACFTITKESA